MTRYNVAYINHEIYAGDNGRVLGFDNAHSFHHRHYMGSMEPTEFENYEATLERSQQEWRSIVDAYRKLKP